MQGVMQSRAEAALQGRRAAGLQRSARTGPLAGPGSGGGARGGPAGSTWAREGLRGEVGPSPPVSGAWL